MKKASKINLPQLFNFTSSCEHSLIAIVNFNERPTSLPTNKIIFLQYIRFLVLKVVFVCYSSFLFLKTQKILIPMQTGNEPATYWTPMKHSNHWTATRTQPLNSYEDSTIEQLQRPNHYAATRTHAEGRTNVIFLDLKWFKNSNILTRQIPWENVCT